jgi:hypothetical protein
MKEERTNWMHCECWTVGDRSVLAEEYDLRDRLSSGFQPSLVKIILCNDAAFMLQ